MRGITRYVPYALAVLRIVVAYLFIEHGARKLFGIPAPASGGGGGAGHLPPMLLVAGILEAFGGLAVLLGLFTRPVAFLLSGEMAIAYWTAHAPRNFFPINNGGDAPILFCFAFLYLVFAGPGAWSLDGLRRRNPAA